MGSRMDVKFRSGASTGLWCSLLLPFALLSRAYSSALTELHITACVLVFGLFIILLWKSISVKCYAQPTSFLSILIYTVITTLLLNTWTNYGLTVLSLTTAITAFCFDGVCTTLLLECPGSFSVGEASSVAQSIALFISTCFLSVVEEVQGGSSEHICDFVECVKFLKVLLMGCIMLVVALHTFPSLHSVRAFYIACVITGIIMIGVWTLYLGQNPVVWLLTIIVKTAKRIILMALWVVLTVASVLFVVFKLNRSSEVSTLTRKYFHLIIVMVYLPGVFLDPAMLYLASSVTLVIFIALETFRILNIPPFGPAIDVAYQVFLDEKDSGVLILTHIYLLVGCSCPLWIYPPQSGLHLSHLSGIIAVGLGDTVAATTGSAFGKCKWKGTNKTVEGTIASILMQLLALYAFLVYADLLSTRNFFLVFVAAVMTSLLEAKTTQIDNLVLPLFMFSFLSLIR